jgi:magnesium chelatase family protein
MPAEQLEQYEFAGELSLSGELRPIRGALAMTFAMHRNRANGDTRAFILPRANADEAALVKDAIIFPADSLLQVCAHFAATNDNARLQQHTAHAAAAERRYPDFSEVKGQLQAKRALEVAAAGGHSVLMIGPPGTGKSMLAARFPGILPPMTEDEAVESAAVQSLTTGFSVQNWKIRPYRAPHHTASAVALVGGGHTPRPGEISLAHRGVLFLDEFPEFDRRVLEVLREPLEAGRITISRAARQADFPAHFQLVAAMNPCPCGYLGHANGKCHCTPDIVKRYQDKISGPLLDRIDMQIPVNALPQEDLLKHAAGESSTHIAKRTTTAFAKQIERQGKSNHQLSPAEIDKYCIAEPSAEQLLRNAMTRLNWSARACHRVLKVARTIADLADATDIGQVHIAEAIQYRRALREQ